MTDLPHLRPPESSDPNEAEATKGKRILFVLVVVVLAINAALLYRVLVSPQP